MVLLWRLKSWVGDMFHRNVIIGSGVAAKETDPNTLPAIAPPAWVNEGIPPGLVSHNMCVLENIARYSQFPLRVRGDRKRG